MVKQSKARKIRKLTSLKLKEISGVDHPASLHEGWAVMKSEDDPIGSTIADAMILEDNALEKNVDTETTVDAVDEQVEQAPEMDLAKSLEDMRKELDDSRSEVAKLREEAMMKDALRDTERWAIVPELDPAEFAPVVCALRQSAPEQMSQIATILDAVAVALGEAGILKEIGSDADSDSDNAFEKIESLAKAMVESGQVTSLADGISKVAIANPDLYSAYVAEMGA